MGVCGGEVLEGGEEVGAAVFDGAPFVVGDGGVAWEVGVVGFWGGHCFVVGGCGLVGDCFDVVGWKVRGGVLQFMVYVAAGDEVQESP